MKRVAFIAMSVIGLAFAGCGGGEEGTGGNGGTAGSGGAGGSACSTVACTTSSACDVGQFCSQGCCEDFQICRPGDCVGGDFCDTNTGECRSPSEACDLDGCECAIVGSAGQLELGANPSDIVVAAGGSFDVEVLVAFVDGGPVPGADVSLAVGDTALFGVTGMTLDALAGAGGTTTLTATVGGLANAVTCTANLNNLGDAPAGQVRIYVFDDATGTPVQGATVIVDEDQDGADDGTTPVTDADGLATTTTYGGGAYTVTVFATDYNYLSVVGLTGDDLALPLQARPAEPQVGGFTGRVDFTQYEELFLDGRPKALRFGLAASSFPLKALLNFDLSLFVGDLNTDGCTNASDPGCYEIEFPGFDAIVAPLPGGVILELGSNVIKEHMDVVGIPGRRYAWSLGGEVDISDLSELIGILLPLLSDCDCDTTADVCDTDTGGGNCTCDTDCGLPLDFGGIFNGLLPLFANFASGVQGNIQLSATDESDWNSYIGPDYNQRVGGAEYPKLDDGQPMGKLAILEPLREFSALEVPNLPADPLSASGDPMEAMLVLTGVEVPGQGFVPLGLSAGLDCTAGDGACLDRANNPGEFDAVVNGGRNCFFDPDPAKNTCPPGVPETVGNGLVGLYHAKAHSGLSTGRFLTIAIALPLTSFFSEDDGGIRATAYVVRDEPDVTADPATSNMMDCPTCDYPGYPATDDYTDGNYTTSADADLHWVTFARNDTRWNVYMASGGAFVAPDPDAWTSGAENPLTPATGGGDIDADSVNVTHIGMDFDAGGPTVESLAAHNGNTLTDALSVLRGFGVVSTDVCAVAAPNNCP